MPRAKKPEIVNEPVPYTCPRCLHKTMKRSNIMAHFNKQTVCQAKNNINAVNLTPNIIKYVLDNRIYHVIAPTNYTATKQVKQAPNFSELQARNEYLEKRIACLERSERFYQDVVEEYLGGTHKRLKYGITDVTNDRVHAEIKNWNSCHSAMGQLEFYNALDPKEELHIYLFGPIQKLKARIIIDLLIRKGYKVHTFIEGRNVVSINSHNEKRNVFTKSFETVVDWNEENICESQDS